MTSQPGKQTVAIHVMPNMSRSKDNERMKFGQLIEYNMINFFLEKSNTDLVQKLCSETLIKIDQN